MMCRTVSCYSVLIGQGCTGHEFGRKRTIATRTMSEEQDHYEVLGVSPDASTEGIREAYRRLAFRYHPDRNQLRGDADERMARINEAYTILSDPLRRKAYDVPRGHGSRVPLFEKGTRVKVNSSSTSLYRGRTGVVDKDPIKDTFRFWYMVRFESQGFEAISRFAEEELDEAGG